MRIAYLSSEISPYAKTGGLGEVSAALPKALAARGHDVTCFLPRYGTIPFPPGRLVGSVHVPVDATPRSAGYYEVQLAPRLRLVFVEHPPFFDRDGIYGDSGGDFPDNEFRYAFFSRAVIEYFRARGERPDVFHCHDWQTGLLPVYLKAFYWDDPTLYRSATVFTIHNLAYQGHFPLSTLRALGLPPVLGTADGLEMHGNMCFMKGGVLFSEMVTTVSETYAREIQTAEFGVGFEGILAERASDLVGIVNGVDYDEWNPETDDAIAARYDASDHSGKVKCKEALLAEFSLPSSPDLPLVGVISRLVGQKGFDIVADAIDQLTARPIRMVTLGSGESEVEEGLREYTRRDPSRFAARFRYDSGLAHRIEAGADMILMPSRFEPCGLTQLYSLKYGTPPIVRATGGLADTVEHWNPKTKKGTGFLFQHADVAGLMWGIDEALRAYANPGPWSLLMKHGMEKNFGWEGSAKKYETVYSRALQNV